MPAPNPESLPLRAALRLRGHEHLALVGAGGKTRTLFTLARQLAPALVATTTHLALGEEARADAHWVWPSDVRPTQARAALRAWNRQGVLLITGPAQANRWTATPALDAVQAWAQSQGLPVLVEADGAARRDLKAPVAHEPAWPPHADGVLVLAHAGVLGLPLAPERVHRAARFAALAGVPLNAPLTVDAVARVLLHAQGPTRGHPPAAWVQAVLRAEEPRGQAAAGRLARALLRGVGPYRAAVVVRTDAQGQVQPLAVETRRAGVVLAAGGARRFGGRPKMLLPWLGQPLVRRAVQAARLADLRPVFVVVGAHAEAVAAAVAELPVQVVPNPAWSGGLSTSVRAALHRALAEPASPEAVVFFPADQPAIIPRLPRALVEAHAAALPSIVAPLIMGERRGQPVLFDLRTFPDLARLEGDVGGRALFARHRWQPLPWFDPALGWDIDTPDDWARWQRLAEGSP